MVGNTGTFLGRGFRRTDVHAAVEQARISRDNFPVQPLGQLNGKLGFANSGRANEQDQGIFGHGFSAKVGYRQIDHNAMYSIRFIPLRVNTKRIRLYKISTPGLIDL